MVKRRPSITEAKKIDREHVKRHVGMVCKQRPAFGLNGVMFSTGRGSKHEVSQYYNVMTLREGGGRERLGFPLHEQPVWNTWGRI